MTKRLQSNDIPINIKTICSNSKQHFDKQHFDKSIKYRKDFTSKFLPMHKSIYGNIRCITQSRQSQQITNVETSIYGQG